MHVGPAESPEEFGYYTDQQDLPSDDPAGEGFSHLYQIYEDDVSDGSTEYTDPTDGDETVLKQAALKVAAGYSWLPGTRNEKLMPYYELGVTQADIEWMRDNDSPDIPQGLPQPPKKEPVTDKLWEARRAIITAK